MNGPDNNEGARPTHVPVSNRNSSNHSDLQHLKSKIEREYDHLNPIGIKTPDLLQDSSGGNTWNSGNTRKQTFGQSARID